MTQVSQQAGEMAMGDCFRGIRPEEEAEVLAGDGLPAGSQSVEQGARLAARDSQGLTGPRHGG